MNNPFKKGDILICVDINYRYGNIADRTYPSLKSLYTVRGTYENCVWLDEIVNEIDETEQLEPMFFHWHFIKLEQMLAEDMMLIKEEAL